MKWLDFVEQVLGAEIVSTDAAGSWELVDDTGITYDEQGLTVVSDLDGDGLIDRVSRMDYSGTSCTVDLSDWGVRQDAPLRGTTPERGRIESDGTPQDPGWGVVEWG